MRTTVSAGTSRGARLAWWGPLVALAAIVYIPLLLTEPGRVAADTKTYLYLEPGRLLSRAMSMWDPHIGLGTVPHQQIGYLWPMGPYYWLMEQLGAPDWVAQRLWVGTIMVAAGAGVMYLGRTWRWRPSATAAAAFVYALSPFVLTLAARISVILLPFAGLPWLLALTVRSLRTRGWRHPAAFALVVATIGSVNATALLLVGLVPVGWILYSTLLAREVTGPHAAYTAAKIGLLTVACNLWWIAGLSVQATNGLNVLRYTETAEVVALASTAPEVLRGLGYWFFYGGDRLGAWIEPGVDYTQHLWLIGLTYAIPAVGLLALGISRWRHRSFLIGMLAVGTVIAVGAHPWDRPSLVGSLIQAFVTADIGLAMRSLPRAVPLVALALALGIGSLVGAAAEQVPRRGVLGAVAAALVAVAALPPLWMREFVPENLQRPEEIPDYWVDAADHLDSAGEDTRVLEIPGTDFAAYRWGNTVDPITPGLIDRPYVARELIPYGSPASADLLNAVDLRLQEDTLVPEVLAPLARLMGAGDIVTRNDLQYERYNTPRPRTLWSLVRRAPGLGEPATFGPSTPNVPVQDAPLVDERHLAGDRDLPDPPAVAAFPVADPVPIVRTRSDEQVMILSGDGMGIVDAAAAGLIEGDELVRYSATLTDDPDFAVEHLVDQRYLVVTDTNRARGERWTTVRHTQGFTEQADGGLLRDDASDNRLPVFEERPGIHSVAEHRNLSVRATGYGNPISFTPEERPANATDGDPRTAWRVAAFEDPRGHRLELTPEESVAPGSLRLLQPVTGEVNRWITEVELRFDGGDPLRVALDESSRTVPGQTIDIGDRRFEMLTIEILDDTAGRRPGYGGLTSVGFAEVDLGVQTRELVRMPQDLLDAAGFRSLRYPLALVQTRERSAPTEVTRADEETRMARVVSLPTARDYRLTGTARLSARAPGAVLDELLGRSGPLLPQVEATSRLPGGLAHLPSNVLDDDPDTWWTSEFGAPQDQQITIRTAAPVTASSLSIATVDDDEHSAPTRIAVSADGRTIADAEVGAIGDSGVRMTDIQLPAPVTATDWTISFPDVQVRTTIDWNSDDPEALPLAVARVGIPGVVLPPVPEVVDSGCRADLVSVDGVGVPVRVTGSGEAAILGRPLDLRSCDEEPVTLPGGERIFETGKGLDVGIDVDQLLWCSEGGGTACTGDGPLVEGPASASPLAEVVGGDDATVEIAVRDAQPGVPFWLVLGQSHNSGWQIVEEEIVHEPTALVDGYANGFLITPDAETMELTLRFVPQNRVEVGLILTVIAVVGTVGLVLLPVRPSGPAPIPLQEPVRRIRALEWEGALPTRRDAIVVGLGAGVAALAVSSPLIGVLVGLLTGFAARRETWRGIFTVLPAGLLGIVGLYVIAVQYRNDIGPGLHWPQDTGRLHEVGLLAVILLVVDVVIEELWSRRSDLR